MIECMNEWMGAWLNGWVHKWLTEWIIEYKSGGVWLWEKCAYLRARNSTVAISSLGRVIEYKSDGLWTKQVKYFRARNSTVVISSLGWVTECNMECMNEWSRVQEWWTVDYEKSMSTWEPGTPRWSSVPWDVAPWQTLGTCQSCSSVPAPQRHWISWQYHQRHQR